MSEANLFIASATKSPIGTIVLLCTNISNVYTPIVLDTIGGVLMQWIR